uniref:Methyltransferase n=1 Tax=Megaviridae environmental sample TaxID=1737588 RepID=A0A5J6VKL3_9VIRU|nr:MAG: hypothetical protein [Megaviridae environmental sample]
MKLFPLYSSKFKIHTFTGKNNDYFKSKIKVCYVAKSKLDIINICNLRKSVDPNYIYLVHGDSYNNDTHDTLLREFRHIQAICPIMLSRDEILLNGCLISQLPISKINTMKDLYKECVKRWGMAIVENSMILDNNINYMNHKFTCDFKMIANKNLPTYSHGWMDNSVKHNLIWAIKSFNPKVIIELGTWLATSSQVLLQYMDVNAELYLCDKFTPLVFSNQRFTTYNCGDRFYFNVPRIETCIGNLSQDLNNKTVIFKGGEIYDTLKSLKRADMYFIDFEKSFKRLLKLLLQLAKFNPVIVGDDYGFQGVKKAIAKFNTLVPRYSCHIYGVSYVLFIKSKNTPIYVRAKTTRDAHIAAISGMSLDMAVDLKYPPEYIALLIVRELKNHQHNNVIKYMNHVDFNHSYLVLGKNNTCYHYLGYYYRNNIDVWLLFTQEQTPLHIYNSYMLTAYEYFTHHDDSLWII